MITKMCAPDKKWWNSVSNKNSAEAHFRSGKHKKMKIWCFVCTLLKNVEFPYSKKTKTYFQNIWVLPITSKYFHDLAFFSKSWGCVYYDTVPICIPFHEVWWLINHFCSVIFEFFVYSRTLNKKKCMNMHIFDFWVQRGIVIQFFEKWKDAYGPIWVFLAMQVWFIAFIAIYVITN
jgi:hypothetical protein